MFTHYRTVGLIFKKEERGEFDQLFNIFSKDFGKLEILGKGIKKISSKLRSGMEIFYLSEIEFIQGKRYKTLTDALPIEKFKNLRKDLKKLVIAYKISEDLDNFVKGEEPDEKIWQLLLEVFNILNNWKIENSLKSKVKRIENSLSIENWKLKIIYYYFFWNFISILGFKPELYFCSICQKKLIPEKLYFSQKEGGIICDNCSKMAKSALKIEPEIVKILRKILEKNWEILLKLKIKENYLKSLEKISQNYSLFISDKEHDNIKKNSQRG